MIFQCKNCNHHYKGLYKLRRHYLSYLPYYFGPYICVICELSFDSELKLINHIVRKKHTGKNNSNFAVKDQRKAYFEKPENKYFGTKDSQFNEEDVKHFKNSKGVSNYDLGPALDFVITIEDSDSNNSSNHSKTMELNKFSNTVPQQFYETVTPMGLPNTSKESTEMEIHTFGGTSKPQFYDDVTVIDITSAFQENLKSDSCTLPSPPVDRHSKRKVANVESRIDTNVTLEILNQRVQNLELKIDTMEKHLKDDLRQAKDEVVEKIERSMNYDRQLFHAVTTQFREIVIDILSKLSQASFTILNSINTQSTSDR